MNGFRGLLAAVCAALCSTSMAAAVYVMSSNNFGTDEAVLTALSAQGHSPTLGVTYNVFDGSVSLAGFQAVYVQANSNWTSGPMPTNGQQQLRQFVISGGGLVTSEWVGWLNAVGTSMLPSDMFPMIPTTYYAGSAVARYEKEEPNAIIDNGVPDVLDMPMSSYAGTETLYAVPADTGHVFFRSTMSWPNGLGLAGMEFGAGRVASFSTVCGPIQLDAMQQLFGNVFRWVAQSHQAFGIGRVTIINGSSFTGNLASFQASDNNRFCFFDDTDTLQGTLELEGQCPSANPNGLTFSMESSASRPGLVESVMAYNFGTGELDPLSAREAPLTDQFVSAEYPSTAAYLGNNRRVIVGLDWSPINDEVPSQDGWLLCVDYATWIAY